MAERRRMSVVVFACSEGIWTRIRGPLSGAWYGPWRFHDMRLPFVAHEPTRSGRSVEQ